MTNIFLAILMSARGLTIEPQIFEFGGDVTHEVEIGSPIIPQRNKIIQGKKEKQTPIDSCKFYGRILPDRKFIIKVSPKIELIFPDTLPDIVRQAIEAAPGWLKFPLEEKFKKMNATCRNTYANLIIQTPSPYKDEIAFQIAYIDHDILNHHQKNPQLFIENVKLIYEHDKLLEYVELVDYPDYTTTKYKIGRPNRGDTIEVEIPKEIYYHFIVHPIVGWEAPLYIDPKIPDIDHSGAGEAPPPRGHFWRSYYFSYPDTARTTVWSIGIGGYDTIYAGTVFTPLGEVLKGEKILWNMTGDTINNGAIARITKWVNDAMVFNSGRERPWQPVRIYHMHIGRCGEHGHITGAAARTALIPSNYIVTWANDHVWNEFYDTQWRQWEPVLRRIDNPNGEDGYDAWWDMAWLFAYRGDGYFCEVTERYTKQCTLTVIVTDRNDKPIDGARVLIARYHPDHNVIIWAGMRFSGSDGVVRFVLGDSNRYYARIDSDIGRFPENPNEVVRIIAPLAIPGRHYVWRRKLTGTMPTIAVGDTYTAIDSVRYKISIEFRAKEEFMKGHGLGNELKIWPRWEERVNIGNIEFFICNEPNYQKYMAGQPFKAYRYTTNCDTGNLDFPFPTSPDSVPWYIVFSNEDQLHSTQLINIKATVYKGWFGIEEKEVEPEIRIYPTVVTSHFYLHINSNKKDKINIEIFDISGRCLTKMVRDLDYGNNKIKIETKEMGSGIYFIKINGGGNKELIKKLVRFGNDK